MQIFIDMLQTFIQGGNVVSFLVYMTLVATLCAWEQHRYFNEVMQTPIQSSNEGS